MGSKMQVTETANEGLKRQFKIQIPAAELSGEVEKRLDEMGKTARLPGFRPGKVPKSLLKKQYGQALMGEIVERRVNESSQKTIDERGLRISLVSRHIVFAPNVADLSPRGVRVLDVIAPVLHDLTNQIEVAGHTNQVKVKPKFYPSDWELSAARAVTVLRHLKEKGGVPGEHMMAAAYGHEQPLIDPSKPHSQELNKRVDILVLSTARDEVRALFDEALRAQHLT